MKIGARPLLVLHSDEQFRERVRKVAGKEYTFQAVPDWVSLEEAVRDSPPSALVVVNPYEESNGRAGPSPSLRSLLVEFPSTAVFAALEVKPERFDDLRTLGKWGVVQVISISHDDTPQALVQRFRQSQGRPLKALLEQVLPADTPGRARAIVDAAAEVVAVGGHGRDLARSLHLSRRTLLRWCERAELPPPRKLLAWMRILLAAELLDDPGRTVLSVAHACGYSSDSGLRRVTQKFVGASPTDLRRRGAFARASKSFLEVLAKYRSPSSF
ncbi:MAG TPA: helix-turn-helix domain-containing protein [Longimicrobiaceae bacterium]|nr:helix-turn-helix domain-containing protein [Longimicrobiaceae bacterium]